MERHKGVGSVEISVHECKQQTPTLCVLPTPLPPEEMVPGKTLEFLCNPAQFSLPLCLSDRAITETRGKHSFYRQCV